jgi:hypothetical protein
MSHHLIGQEHQTLFTSLFKKVTDFYFVESLFYLFIIGFIEPEKI